jgi:hypothetical protein
MGRFRVNVHGYQYRLCGDGTSLKKKVVSSKFDWSDLGSFESVYDYLKL